MPTIHPLALANKAEPATRTCCICFSAIICGSLKDPACQSQDFSHSPGFYGLNRPTMTRLVMFATVHKGNTWPQHTDALLHHRVCSL